MYRKVTEPTKPTLRAPSHERQKPLPVIYKDVHLDAGYRLDLFVNNRVAVKLKAANSTMKTRALSNALIR